MDPIVTLSFTPYIRERTQDIELSFETADQKREERGQLVAVS